MNQLGSGHKSLWKSKNDLLQFPAGLVTPCNAHASGNWRSNKGYFSNSLPVSHISPALPNFGSSGKLICLVTQRISISLTNLEQQALHVSCWKSCKDLFRIIVLHVQYHSSNMEKGWNLSLSGMHMPIASLRRETLVFPVLSARCAYIRNLCGRTCPKTFINDYLLLAVKCRWPSFGSLLFMLHDSHSSQISRKCIGRNRIVQISRER